MTRIQIKEAFITEAIKHGLAISDSKDKEANKIHKKIQNLYLEAKKQNQVNVFGELLDANNHDVRLWAATFTLTSDPEKASEILKKLAELPTITSTTAKMILDLWEKDMLNLL